MATTFFVKTYGPYSYGDNLASVEAELSYRSQTSSPAGRGGRRSSGNLFDCLHLTLSGMIVAASFADPSYLQAAVDAFNAAHAPGVARPFYIHSDRYCNAEVESDIRFETWRGEVHRSYSMTLAAYDDPPWFAANPAVTALAVGTTTVTTAGTAVADPVFTITVSGAGPVTITIGSASCTFTPTGAGTFTVDSYQEALTLAGADQTALLSPSSAFLRLQPGPNSVTLAGAALTAASVSVQDRWY